MKCPVVFELRDCLTALVWQRCGGGVVALFVNEEAVLQATDDGPGASAGGEGRDAAQVAPGVASGVASASGVAADVEKAVPNPPAIYDFLLGGKDNTQVDRAAAEGLLQALPDTKAIPACEA